jgi:uncharacterized membrane protein YgdD (TMEM256/DUF423 family)
MIGGMKIWFAVAALNGAVAVLCGAFAAHGLKARLAPDMLAVFDTGARYHMSHALAMGLAALAGRGAAARQAGLAAMLFLVGIVLFSGSLYLLALSGMAAFGYVTPIGGMAFIAGWIMLAVSALKWEAR